MLQLALWLLKQLWQPLCSGDSNNSSVSPYGSSNNVNKGVSKQLRRVSVNK